jgi:hypothetical protein
MGNILLMPNFPNPYTQAIYEICDFTTYMEFFAAFGSNKAKDRQNGGKKVTMFDQKQWHFFRGLEPSGNSLSRGEAKPRRYVHNQNQSPAIRNHTFHVKEIQFQSL